MNPETSLENALDLTGQSIAHVAEGLRTPIVAVSFWLAVTLPFMYVPLLFVTGLSTTTEQLAFVALLLANVVTLLVGHSYHREPST